MRNINYFIAKAQKCLNLNSDTDLKGIRRYGKIKSPAVEHVDRPATKNITNVQEVRFFAEMMKPGGYWHSIG